MPRLRRHELQRELESQFRPMRPASTPRLVLAAIFGPLLWVLCVLFAVFLVESGEDVLIGTVVAAVSLVLAVIILLLLRRGRIKEEEEFADSA